MKFKVIAHCHQPNGNVLERNEVIDTDKEKAFNGITTLEAFTERYEKVKRWGVKTTEVKMARVVK